MNNRRVRPLAGLLLILASLTTTTSAAGLPIKQSASDTMQDLTVTLQVKDRVIDGDERSFCQVRVEVVGVAQALTAGDLIMVWVYKDELAGDELIFGTVLTVSAAQAGAGLVDQTFDCSGSFPTTGELAVSVYASATAEKDTCSGFCMNDSVVTNNLSVAVEQDDLFEEDDSAGDAVLLALAGSGERICRDGDWWSFELLAPSRLNCELQFDPADGTLSADVLDASSLNVVAGATQSASGADLEAVLPSGSYYLRVVHDLGDDYNFYDYSVSVASTECIPGHTEDRACGNCGLQTRSCEAGGIWSAYGACSGEGECTPGDLDGRLCEGGVERRVCEASCLWGDYGLCDSGCLTGETVSCYDGPSDTRNVGVCVGGTRTCTNGVWGACDGAVLPSDELCSDDLDNDCDGTIDTTDTNCATSQPPSEEGCGCNTGGGRPLGGVILLLLLLVGLHNLRRSRR